MAETWEYLADVRGKISDPAGVIALDHVTDYASLPSSPSSQTAYRADDTGIYYIYDSGLSAWEVVDLLISDDRLNNLIDLYGSSASVYRAITIILSTLYNEMRVVNQSAGAESTQYQTLTDTLNFYKSLKEQYKEEDAQSSAMDTGRVVMTRRAPVGGFDE